MLVSKIYHFFPTTWTPPIWSIILLWYGAVLPRISHAFSTTVWWVSRGTSYALEGSLVVHMIIRILFVHQRLGQLIFNKGGAQGKGQFVSLSVHIDKLWNVSHSKWRSSKITLHVVNKYRKIPAGWGKERKAFVWNFRPWSTIQVSDKWPRSCSTPCGATFREDRVEVY